MFVVNRSPDRSEAGTAWTLRVKPISSLTLGRRRPRDVQVSTESLNVAAALGASSKQTPSTSWVPEGQAGLKVPGLRSAEVRLPSATLTPVTALFLILAVVMDSFLIFDAVTAFFFSLPVVIELPLISFEPIFLAAYAAPPPRTRKTAIDDITFAYVIRLRI